MFSFLGEMSSPDGAPVPFAPPLSCSCCRFLSEGDIFLPPIYNPYADRERQDVDIRTEMSSPQVALQLIRDAAFAMEAASGFDLEEREDRVLLVDTHGHAQLEREGQVEYSIPQGTIRGGEVPGVVSLACAVSESDWHQTLSYARRSVRVLPGLGIHPWYLENVSPNYLVELERLLILHPNAVVGEIGLCKVARFVRSYPEGKPAAMELQRRVFREQFELAAKLVRPVTVHCVQQHGVIMNILKDIRENRLEELKAARRSRWERENDLPEGKGQDPQNSDKGCAGNSFGNLLDAFPPAVGMHSFTGTAHHVKDILKFEESLFTGKFEEPGSSEDRNKKRPPIFYFGFSHSVNVLMCSSDKSQRQGKEAIQAVPLDRLLAESDVHSSNDTAAGTAGSVSYLSFALGKPLLETAEITANNGMKFLCSATSRMKPQ